MSYPARDERRDEPRRHEQHDGERRGERPYEDRRPAERERDDRDRPRHDSHRPADRDAERRRHSDEDRRGRSRERRDEPRDEPHRYHEAHHSAPRSASRDRHQHEAHRHSTRSRTPERHHRHRTTSSERFRRRSAEREQRDAQHRSRERRHSPSRATEPRADVSAVDEASAAESEAPEADDAPDADDAEDADAGPDAEGETAEAGGAPADDVPTPGSKIRHYLQSMQERTMPGAPATAAVTASAAMAMPAGPNAAAAAAGAWPLPGEPAWMPVAAPGVAPAPGPAPTVLGEIPSGLAERARAWASANEVDMAWEAMPSLRAALGSMAAAAGGEAQNAQPEQGAARQPVYDALLELLADALTAFHEYAWLRDTHAAFEAAGEPDMIGAAEVHAAANKLGATAQAVAAQVNRADAQSMSAAEAGEARDAALDLQGDRVTTLLGALLRLDAQGQGGRPVARVQELMYHDLSLHLRWIKIVRLFRRAYRQTWSTMLVSAATSIAWCAQHEVLERALATAASCAANAQDRESIFGPSLQQAHARKQECAAQFQQLLDDLNAQPELLVDQYTRRLLTETLKSGGDDPFGLKALRALRAALRAPAPGAAAAMRASGLFAADGQMQDYGNAGASFAADPGGDAEPGFRAQTPHEILARIERMDAVHTEHCRQFTEATRAWEAQAHAARAPARASLERLLGEWATMAAAFRGTLTREYLQDAEELVRTARDALSLVDQEQRATEAAVLELARVLNAAATMPLVVQDLLAAVQTYIAGSAEATLAKEARKDREALGLLLQHDALRAVLEAAPPEAFQPLANL